MSGAPGSMSARWPLLDSAGPSAGRLRLVDYATLCVGLRNRASPQEPCNRRRPHRPRRSGGAAGRRLRGGWIVHRRLQLFVARYQHDELASQIADLSAGRGRSAGDGAKSMTWAPAGGLRGGQLRANLVKLVFGDVHSAPDSASAGEAGRIGSVGAVDRTPVLPLGPRHLSWRTRVVTPLLERTVRSYTPSFGKRRRSP